MVLRLRKAQQVEIDIAHQDGTAMLHMVCPGREADPHFSFLAVLEYFDNNTGGWHEVKIET